MVGVVRLPQIRTNVVRHRDWAPRRGLGLDPLRSADENPFEILLDIYSVLSREILYFKLG